MKPAQWCAQMKNNSQFINYYQPEGLFPAEVTESAVVIGNFDGIHRGHRAVLEFAKSVAQSKGLSLYLLTFEPHPYRLLFPEQPLYRLSQHDKKAHLAQKAGVNGIISLHFTDDFSTQSPDWFIHEILLKRLQVKHVIVGYDFHFGKDRAGTPDYLSQQGTRLGFDVNIVNMKADVTGMAVSSTRIREALRKGSLQEANTLLGYHHYLSLSSEMLIRPCALRHYTKVSCHLSQKEIMPAGIYSIHLKQSSTPFAQGFAELSHDQQQLTLYVRQPNQFETAFNDETQIMFIDYLSAAVGSSTSEDWLGIASDHMSRSSHEPYVDYVM
jgi:riboflavin kinase/FMN adenylyltransferase